MKYCEGEICERWSETLAYRDHEQKAKNYTCTDDILQGLARCTLLTSDSRSTTTSIENELLSLLRKQSRCSVRRSDMVKELMRDTIFLAGKSEVATKEDLQVAQDLLDTLMESKKAVFVW